MAWPVFLNTASFITDCFVQVSKVFLSTRGVQWHSGKASGSELKQPGFDP